MIAMKGTLRPSAVSYTHLVHGPVATENIVHHPKVDERVVRHPAVSPTSNEDDDRRKQDQKVFEGAPSITEHISACLTDSVAPAAVIA